MVLLSYHLDDAHLVVELSDAVDLDNEAAIERELLRLMPGCGPSTLIVDVVTPCSPPAPWASCCGCVPTPSSAVCRWRWWPDSRRHVKS